MKTKPKPPFRRGEWVLVVSHGCYRVVRCFQQLESRLSAFGAEPYFGVDRAPPAVQREYVQLAGFGCAYRWSCRRATSRELRAEARRLTKRADELNAAADAIKTARKRITEESSGTAKGKR